MFQEMRRSKQLLTEQACIAILERGTSGVLALLGDDDYPYALPISYVYSHGKLYFHSAKSGHKIDAIRKCNRASFCVIDQDLVAPEEYTTYFRSVIAFGTLRILEDPLEIREAIGALAFKYHPEDTAENRGRTIAGAQNAFSILELSIAHMTGKEATELAKRK